LTFTATNCGLASAGQDVGVIVYKSLSAIVQSDEILIIISS
jgi:hypothetical protein